MATDSTHLLPGDTSIETGSDMFADSTDLGSVQLAAATADAPIPVDVPRGQQIVVVPVRPGQTIELPTDSPNGLLAKLGADGNLAIVVDGRTIILQGYAEANAESPIKIVTNDGDVVDIAEVIVATNPDVALDIQTAAGPAAAGAQGGTAGADAAGSGIFVPFAAGPLLGGFDPAGVLKATQLAYKNIDDEREFFLIEEADEEPAPTPEITIGAESGLDTICVPEDSQGEAVAVQASTDATSHLTTIVISGFPIGGGGFTFNFLGLDLGNTTVTDTIAVDGKVTITFTDAVTTDFSGSFIVTPAADSDVDLGTLTAEVIAANNADPTVKASSSDDAFVRVDAVADGDDVGDDGDGDKLGVSIAVADGGDLNTSFQAGESGFVHISASFDDFKDGSETHALTVTAPAGFTFGVIGVLPAGVSLVSNDGTTIVLSVDSKDGDGQDGVGNFVVNVPVTYNGGQADGPTGNFVATVSATETPTDAECDTGNNSDTATQGAAATVAEIPTPEVQIGAEAGLDHVCVFEDTTSDPISVTASTNAGSHLTTIVISGFPVGGAGFSFDFLGLDFVTTTVTDNIAVDGTVTITFLNNSTTGFTGSFTVTPPADSDVDLGTLTATVNAANNVDPSVTASDNDQAQVVVDAVADGDNVGDDGDADALGVTISVTDGGDANATFQNGEVGNVHVTASFDDFKDGSESHTLIVEAPEGFTFDTNNVGTLPTGVALDASSTSTKLVFIVDSKDGDGNPGVSDLTLDIPVTYGGGEADGESGDFTATVTTTETPTDKECDVNNNSDSASAIDDAVIASVPTTDISINTEGREDVVCVPEDSDGVQIPVTATTTPGSHLTTIVISGFPTDAVSDGWVFDFNGLDNADTSVDFSKISVDGTVTITFDNTTTTNFNGSFIVTPPADSDVDLGILTATVEGANNVDPSVKDTDADAAFVRVDAVADGDNVGDDGDGDVLGVTISVTDGGDANATFQDGEVGNVHVTASFDDFKDGSETHTLTVEAPDGFTFDTNNVGTLPTGVTLDASSTSTKLVFIVDSKDGDGNPGVSDLTLDIPVTYGGGEEEGESGDFTATVTTTETPTDQECDTKNNTDSASATDDVVIAGAPTTDIRIGAEGNTEAICVPEDSAGVAIPVVASTTPGSHLTTIVISGFPTDAVSDGWVFDFTGLDNADTSVDFSQISVNGTVTITFINATTTNFNGSFSVSPPDDSDVDLGTLTAEITAASNVDPTVTDTDSDDAFVRVDAVADGDNIGNDGDADVLDVTISVADGGDANATFQDGEVGTVTVTASYDDFTDGSETHTLTVSAPAGFTFDLGNLGTIPAGVVLNAGASSTTHLVFEVDSEGGDGVADFTLNIPVTYGGGQSDGESGDFTAVVTTSEDPTDLECDLKNNTDTDSATDAVVIATTPTTNVSLNAEGNTDFVCVPEDSAGVAVPVTASTSAGSHLTTIVISGFPVGGGGFTFSFAGLDLANTTVTNNIAVDGTVTITFDNATTTNFAGSFTVIPAADSDVDLGTLTATVTAANDVDPSVTDTDADQTYVRVDAVADGNDGDGETLGVTITSIVDGADGNATFQAGETGKVNVSATFDDYKDGSETHTLSVAAPAGFSFDLGNVGTLPAGVQLDGSSTTSVLVFTVDSSNPGGVGSFNLSIPVTYNGGQADGASGNFTATVNAVETPTDLECDPDNNKATQSDTEATVIANDQATGTLDASACVDEDLQPGQNVGNSNVVAGHIDVTFTPSDNETVTGAKITIPTGWQAQVWDTGTNSQVTLLGAGADQNISAYIANVLSGAYELRPIPPADTDVDGSFTLKLDIEDPDTGLTNTLTENVTVFADAAADKPTGVEIILNDSADGGTSFSLGETGSLQVKATFGDFTDGSETHTVTVTLQDGFTAPTLSANGTEDGFAYTYDAAAGVIVFTVPTGTQNFDVTFDVKAPTVGSLPTTLTFTAEAKAEETTISGGGCGANDAEDTSNNEASTVATAGVPATRILNGDFITNTNVNNQQLLITFVNAANFLLASAQIYSLDIQGQEGSVAQDVGFNIDGDDQYLLSVEAAVNPKVILTDFTLENTTLHDAGNLQFELNDDAAGPDRTAYTWIMTPDNVAPNQGSTESTDGTAANQTLTDPSPTAFNYVYGAGGGDTVNGGAGADILNGGSSADKLNGLGGNDILVYDPLDTIDGGTGDDLLRIDQGAIAITKHQDGSIAGPVTAGEVTVDLSGKNITNIEGILITTEGLPDPNLGTTIQLKSTDVLNYSATDVLYVIGQDGDRVQLLDSANWIDGDGNALNGITATGSFSNAAGQTFNVYQIVGGGTLNVDADVEVIS